MAFWNRNDRNDDPQNAGLDADGTRNEDGRTDEECADDERDWDGESAARVGVCSDCGTALPRSNVVIEYETGDQWEQVALCPECEDLAIA